MIQKLEALIAESQRFAKFFAALATGLLTVGAQFIPTEHTAFITSVVAAVGAFAVYHFSNTPPTPEADAPVVD